MPLLPLIEYEDAAPEVRAVYDDIMSTRGTDWINNFWKVLANHPETLARVWNDVKKVMKPGALDPLVKEMIMAPGGRTFASPRPQAAGSSG